jgi:hypothetical protein
MADTRSIRHPKEANVSKTGKMEQFRFTTWVKQSSPEAAIKDALQGIPDVKLVSLTERRGEYHATIVTSSIPPEIRTWFEHFRKKGIPTAIVKQARTNAYAVFRNGKECGDNAPDTFQSDELSIVEKTPDFVWAGPRVYTSKKVHGKNAPPSEAKHLQPPRDSVPIEV